MATIRHAFPAMHTTFEALLAGDDEEHLQAVARALAAEVCSAERLLSRFDPRAEVFRINQSAPGRPTRISVELWDVLVDCERLREATGGAFDIVLGRGRVLLDPERRTVLLCDPEAQLDFGGYGKGYALDRAAAVLSAFRVRSALLHAGTSSVLAVGRFSVSVAGTVVELRDEALSYSVADGTVDPRTGTAPLASTFVAITPKAALAEALSTAAVVAGRPYPIEKGVRVGRVYENRIEYLTSGH